MHEPETRIPREEALFTNQRFGEIQSLPRGAAFESPVAEDVDYADGRVANETIQRLQAAVERRRACGIACAGGAATH